ncbi:hypothetical protein [Streptomyces sp. SLBN-115]|nr:hypothetical protein [Streptomyces sp. SLBN-115]
MTTHASAVTDGVTGVFRWEEGAHVEVRDLGGEVVIEATPPG